MLNRCMFVENGHVLVICSVVNYKYSVQNSAS